MFPDIKVLFILVIGNEKHEVELDRLHRIWCGGRLGKEIEWETGAEFEITKEQGIRYRLKRIK